MTLDNFITGDFDANNPANQPDEQENEFESVSDALEWKQYDVANDLLCDVREDVKRLRAFFSVHENHYAVKKLTEIYNQL